MSVRGHASFTDSWSYAVGIRWMLTALALTGTGGVALAQPCPAGPVAMTSGACTVPSAATVTSTAAATPALSATGVGAVISGNDITVRASGANAPAAVANDGGTISLTSSRLSTTGAGNSDLNAPSGLRARNGGTVSLTGVGSSISTSNTRGFGVSVEGAGSTAIVSNTTVTTTGARATALRILDAAATLTDDVFLATGAAAGSVSGLGASLVMLNTSITSTATTGAGLSVLAGASATLSGGSVNTEGLNGIALSASNSTVSLAGTHVTTIGQGQAMGVVAEAGGQITMTGGSVSTTGDADVPNGRRPIALTARERGATLSINNTSINTQGLQAYGVVADDGGNATLNGGTLTTQGASAIGLYSIVEQAGADRATSITTNAVSIETQGTAAHGGQAARTFGESQSSITTNDTSVITHGASADGLRAIRAGVVVANRSSIQTSGVAARGVVASNALSTLTLNQSNVVTNGVAAHASFINDNGVLTSNGSTLTATGASASALYAIGEGATVATANITGGSLANTSGATIGLAGTVNLSLSNATVGGSGQWLLVGTTDDFPAVGAPEPPPTGVPDVPVESFASIAQLAHVTLAPQAITLAAVTSGLANITVSGGTLNGSAVTLPGSVSNLALTNAAAWNLSGNSNLSTLSNSASGIWFTPPSAGVFKTLTVGNYVGQNGVIGLNTYLGADASPSDRLVIDGGSASGLTGLRITNSGGPGAVTVANGIQVVSTVNGASTTAAAFVLNTRVVQGPYEYQLFRGTVDASDAQGWYLRSEVPGPPPPDPPVPPSPPGPPTPDVRPLFRPEVSAYLSTQRQAAGMFVHSLHDRLGEPQYIESQTFENQDDKRRSAWLRVVGKKGGATSKDGNFDVDTRSTLIQGGGDLAQWRTGDEKGRYHLGGMIGYGNSTTDARAALNPAHSQGETDGWSVGLYGTWYQNDEEKLGWYTDVWGLYGWYKNSVRGDTLPEVKYNANTLSLSGEAGYAAKLRNDWVVEPQAQIIYVKYNEDDVTEPNGTQVSGSRGSGWISRLGVRFHRTWLNESGRKTQPYLTLNWWHDSMDNRMAFNRIELEDLYPQDRYEVKLGLNADLNKGWTAWGNVGYQWGDQSFRTTTLRLGAKYTW
ncbi:autotransporter outer membrane beta-barrel domain-containing protein [Variovorax sp. HJSM1_2]|uniref:autotransporter outer membrane beta-barrel domain-containing protein n=1 Tax=Variovorax sp. HJSM1_2 TaxID=3366263 RepID=UPI003BE21BF2